jgi:hypothetical protein
LTYHNDNARTGQNLNEVRHVCAGIGGDLANYLADQLWHPFFSEQQAVRMLHLFLRKSKTTLEE